MLISGCVWLSSSIRASAVSRQFLGIGSRHTYGMAFPFHFFNSACAAVLRGRALCAVLVLASSRFHGDYIKRLVCE